MQKFLRKYGLVGTMVLGFHIVRAKLFVSPKVRIIKGGSHIFGKKYIQFSPGFSAGVNLRIEVQQVGDTKPVLYFGNNVKMGWNVHIGCIHKIEVKDNVLIGSNILITDHNHGIYSGTEHPHSSPLEIPDDRKITAKPVVIEENVWIGDSTIILPGVTIGKGSVIAAMSLINKDIPENSLVAGSPARIIKKFDFTTNRWEKC